MKPQNKLIVPKMKLLTNKLLAKNNMMPIVATLIAVRATSIALPLKACAGMLYLDSVSFLTLAKFSMLINGQGSIV